MDRIENAPVREHPFPHVFIEDIFPPAFYAELQSRMLESSAYMRLIDTGRVAAGYSPARLCLFPSHVTPELADTDDKRFWADLFAAYNDAEFTLLWLSVFQASIQARVAAGHVPSGLASGPLKAQHEIFLMRDLENYALTPHTDSQAKLVSVLFYLPADNSRQTLGTSLFLPKQPGMTSDGASHLARDDFERVATLPYLPNTLFAFPRLQNSFHGVEPVRQAADARDLLLFDIKFAK